MTAPLLVSVGGVRAGVLQPSHEGSAFVLDDEYLRLPDRPILGQVFEDDPTRPHRTRQGVPSWFANLLPEGPLRHLIAEKAHVHESRSLYLLSLLGDDLPGAVTIHAPDSDAYADDEDAPVMPSDAPLRFSLAGVQMKFSAIREGRGLTVPAQGLGGDWIVKLPDQRFEGVPENEYSMMRLAKNSGIDVPETQLVDVDSISGLPEEVAALSGKALAVRRFDRADQGRRVHIEDFAQVLGLSPAEKYGATNFDTMARVIAAVCPEKDLDEFLRRLVFMVAIGNSDAHAKNWSLIYPDGRAARLAPAYDLVAVSMYEAVELRLKRHLALKLAGAETAQQVTEETFRRLAQRVGVGEERVVSVTRAAVQSIVSAWENLRQEAGDGAPSHSLAGVLDQRLNTLALFQRP